MHDYAGALHFHSEHSYDGRIPLSAILQSAKKAGLHFAVLTDHFRLDARQEFPDGYYDNVLLITGEEISARYNHYLALGIQKPIVVWKSDNNPQQVIDAVNAQGGFGFISHPDHPGAPLFGARAYPWIKWDVTGYAGLGIWDLMSDWQTSLGSFWQAAWSCWRPAHALKGPLPKTLTRWDQLTQKGHCVAIGETDNHGHYRSFFGIRKQVFSFDFAFRTIRTHVWLDQPLHGASSEDVPRILEALRVGRSYVSLDYWNDPTGFSMAIVSDEAQAHCGEEFVRKGPALLEAKIPGPGIVQLWRNGALVRQESRRTVLQWDIDMPGVYRIEAKQHAGGRWRPWIYSNPIWVK